ncbi:hypothetical protein [Desulfovibrio sp. TomC]|uniref:hypothetical protein n=1 Tax=Desulfovibrio sp. TomC TaxID=1562888 RepID=UPI000574E3E4|nr:hypothetical protein [Desulfovibrio sp. TomC]KHK02402.1 hypothetical protein NY78_2160 [Desulfovibrio sp. TomC]
MTIRHALGKIAANTTRASLPPTALALALAVSMAAGSPEAWAGSQTTDPKAASAIEAVCARTDVYDCYANHTYGYVLAWPRKLLKALGESDAGDGQLFVAPDDKARLTCWAGYTNVQGKKLSAVYDQALRESGQEISYKHQGKNFFVLSGTRDGKIFYRKTILEHGVQASFELTYDPSLIETLTPVLADLARSFRIDPAFAWHR